MNTTQLEEMRAIRNTHKNCTGDGQKFNYVSAVSLDSKEESRWDEARDY